MAEAGSAKQSYRLLLVAVVAAMSVAGCSTTPRPPPGTGDPGNARLHQLQEERFITTLPPHAKPSGTIQWFPASWDATNHQWRFANFTWAFTDATPHRDVVAFYDNRSSQFGWTEAPNSTNVPYGGTWAKTYRGGYQADVILNGGGDVITGRTGPHAYTLYGFVSVIEPHHH